MSQSHALWPHAMNATSKPERDIAATIQLPTEIDGPLATFATQASLSKAAICRAGLSYLLPLLLRGDLAVINGKVMPMPQQTPSVS